MGTLALVAADAAAAPPPDPRPSAAPTTAAPLGETAPMPPVEDPPSPAAEAVAPPSDPAPASAAVTEEEAARIDEIDQLVRIAARKHELIEEDAAKRKAEAPSLSVGDQGFSFKVPDGAFSLKLRGLLQADARGFGGDEALQASDTFLIRRFRPTLEGTLFSLVDFRLVPELAGTASVLDATVDLRVRPWLRVRVGKFKAPVGLERLQSDADLPLVERALDQNLSSQRDVGLQLWGEAAGGLVSYAAGIVNGAPDTASADTDINHAKDFFARVFFQPFKSEALRELGTFGFGFAAQTGNRKGRLPTSSAAAQTGLSALRTAGQNTFFTYLAPTTDTTGATTTFTHQRATRLNPQLYFYRAGVGLLAEYIYLRQGVQRGDHTSVLEHQAAHATLSYTFEGREGFDGVTPFVPFDPAREAWGAFQLAARWSWIRFDPATFGDASDPGAVVYADPLRSARVATSFGGGLAWIPRRSLRFSLDGEQTRFVGGGGTLALAATPGVPAMPAVPGDRKTEVVVIGRLQVSF
jgi:phosphate-selective porin OprO and OprP